MGPGGPPGLQNRVGRRKSVGGFDSLPSPPVQQIQGVTPKLLALRVCVAHALGGIVNGFVNIDRDFAAVVLRLLPTLARAVRWLLWLVVVKSES